MDWVSMLPWFLGLIEQFTGMDAKEQFEQMTAEERAQVEQTYGSLDNLAAQVAAIPAGTYEGLSEFSGLFGAGSGQNAPGYGVANPSVNPYGHGLTQAQLEAGVGQYLNAEDDPNPTGDMSVSQLFQNLFNAQPEVPDFFSQVGKAETWSPAQLFDAAEEELAGPGYLRRGQLSSAHPFREYNLDDLMGEYPSADFSAYEQKAKSDLASNVSQNLQGAREQAARLNAATGVLPTSPGGMSSTFLEPQLQAQSDLTSGQTDIAADVQGKETEYGFRRAEAERAARSDLAQLNRAGEQAMFQGRIAEEGIIQGQRTGAQNAIATALGLQQSGTQINLSAAQQQFKNEFDSWGAQVGLSQDMMDRYTGAIMSQAGISLQAAQMQAAIFQSMMQGQLSDDPSLISNQAVLDHALESAIGLWQALNPPDYGGGGGTTVSGTLGFPGVASIGVSGEI